MESEGKVGQYSIVVMGTSFMRRLRDDIKKGASPDLKVNFDIGAARVEFVCQGGWKLPDLKKAVGRVVSAKPQVVLIHAGSNDICDVGAKGEVIGDKLLDLAQEVKVRSGARMVMVCTLTRRSLGKYLTSQSQVDKFNREIDRFNAYVRVVGPTFDGLSAWRHSGFREPSIPLLLEDGVHMNSRGQYKLYKSVRGAMVVAVNRIAAGRVDWTYSGKK